MHKALYPRDDIDRLYAPRKEEGRGFASIQDSGDTLLRQLEANKKKCLKKLTAATKKEKKNEKKSAANININ